MASAHLPPSPYAGWSREQLIERLQSLEGPAKLSVDTPPAVNDIEKPKPSTRKFNFYEYPRRKIALRFSYSGWEYGGLAFQIDDTPLPTVEGVLFDTLSKARLVDEEAGYDGCGWERCGRTDKGVSGAGQVVSLWVRSALPTDELAESITGTTHVPVPVSRDALEAEPLSDGIERREPKEQSRNEHDYVTILNRMLPETIRISAWSPVSSTFSPRFSCLWRHYKYLFSPKDLDISKMQDAASRLIGEHDFRNLCKLDAAKQITSFKRNILDAHIEKYNDNLHIFNLIGSAFLYNQVRHIMAVLFLVGTGLEPPSIVTTLMNVSEGCEPPNGDDPQPYPVVDRKPEYHMADGLPLMLWDCGYPDGTFSWRTSGRLPSDEFKDLGELQREMQNIVTRSHITAALNEHFQQAVARHHPAPPSIFPLDKPSQLQERRGPQQAFAVPLGGGSAHRVVKWVPVLQRKRLDPVEVANERWRVGKGTRKAERRRIAAEGDLEAVQQLEKVAASGGGAS